MPTNKRKLKPAWEAVVFDGDLERLDELDCKAANGKPTAVDIMWPLDPAKTAVVLQEEEDTCALAAVENTGLKVAFEIPPYATLQEVVDGMQGYGVLLGRCLIADKDKPRRRVPHLIYAFDKSDGCDGFLLPYCTTAQNMLVCEYGDDLMRKWLREYNVFIILSTHKMATEEGHYVTVKRLGKSWTLLDPICGAFKLPSQAALLLLMRGADAIIGV